jgi:acyl dehydratase
VKSVSDSHIDLSYKRLLLLTEKLDRRFKNYAQGPNIHTDDAAAKAAGFSRRVVPGIQSYSFISEMLNRFFGMRWVIGGKINLKFIRPFLVGEKITCEAEVTKTFALEKAKERFAELEVCCKNSAGDIVSAGFARIRINDL